MSPGLVGLLSTALWLLGAVAFLVSSVWLSVVDISTRRLPNRLVLRATVVTLGLFAASELVRLPTLLAAKAAYGPRAWHGLAMLVLGALLLFGLFLLLWRIAPGDLGGGDVKVAPLIGGTLGLLGGMPNGFWAVLAAALIAALGAAIWGAVLRSRAGRRPPEAHDPLTAGAAGPSSASVALPFAPCLFIGAWVVIAIWQFAARLF